MTTFCGDCSGANTMRVLIGYASRFGSTRDIAMRIADTVRTHGNEVDVRSVEEISDFGPYDAPTTAKRKRTTGSGVSISDEPERVRCKRCVLPINSWPYAAYRGGGSCKLRFNTAAKRNPPSARRSSTTEICAR